MTSFVLRAESFFPVSTLSQSSKMLQKLESQSWGICHSQKVASNVRGYDKPIHRSGDRHLLFPDGIEVCGFASLFFLTCIKKIVLRFFPSRVNKKQVRKSIYT